MIGNDRTKALLAIVLLVGAVGAVGATSHLLTAGQDTTIDRVDGVEVTLAQDTELSGENPSVGTDGVQVQETVIRGPAGSAVRLSDPSSDAPTLSDIETAAGTVTADTTGIQTIGVSGSISEITYRNVDLQDDTTIELEAVGSGTLDVHGFAADEWIRVNRVSDDDELVQADNAGVASISVSDGAEITIIEPAEGAILSDPSPTDGETFSSPPVELEVDVSHEDFDAGEEVTLEWYVDGSLDGTTTVTQGDTAKFESSAEDGGSHEWYVVATDSTGDSSQSGSDADPHTFSLPDELRIYEETNPDELVTGTDSDPVEIEIRFFQDGEENVVERSTTDGTISLQGLPTDSEFVVTADAEGYEFRRIIVDSLIEQQDVFLLPDDQPSARVIFELSDDTGQFDPVTTRLYVERAINQSSETRYRVIAGDRFGASAEFPVALQDGERYRLRIENDEGRTRTLGAYTVSGDARANLPIGRVEIDTTMQQSIGFGASLDRQADTTEQYARVDFIDPEQLTDQLDLTIVRIDGNEEVVVTEDTITNPGERHLGTYPLPASDPENATYEVRYVADRDGEIIEGSRRIGAVEEIADDLGVDPDVLELIGYLAILAVTGLVILVSPAMAAIAAVVTAAFTTIIGVTPIPGVAIAFSGAIALLYNVARAKGVR